MEVPFFKPKIGQAEIDEVTDCLKNGWLTTGKKSFRFEEEFSEFIGGDVEAVAINSATAGLHLSLEALGVGPGDEVIVPDYTFTATAEVVRYMGADPVFVDVDYATLNITAEVIESAITPKTKAVMPVHFAGLACNMVEIQALAKRHSIAIVEDAAHALPTTSGGTLIGRHGTEATVFSFYANKTMTTGEGGMLVTSNKDIADRARKMRIHGFSRDSFDRFKTGNWRYDIIAPGYKYNLTDIAAALGLHQLKQVEYFRDERARVASRYRDLLSGLPLTLPADAPEGDTHSWHLFIIRLTDECRINRDELFQGLAEAGITCSVHYTPLHHFTYWKETYDLSSEQFPNSTRAGECAISLPAYVEMPDAEIRYVTDQIKRLIG